MDDTPPGQVARSALTIPVLLSNILRRITDFPGVCVVAVHCTVKGLASGAPDPKGRSLVQLAPGGQRQQLRPHNQNCSSRGLVTDFVMTAPSWGAPALTPPQARVVIQGQLPTGRELR